MADDGMSRGFAECPRCCRPVEVAWEWSRFDYVFFGDQYPRFVRHATCPACGARVTIDCKLVPQFFASLDEGGDAR